MRRTAAPATMNSPERKAAHQSCCILLSCRAAWWFQFIIVALKDLPSCQVLAGYHELPSLCEKKNPPKQKFIHTFTRWGRCVIDGGSHNHTAFIKWVQLHDTAAQLWWCNMIFNMMQLKLGYMSTWVLLCSLWTTKSSTFCPYWRSCVAAHFRQRISRAIHLTNTGPKQTKTGCAHLTEYFDGSKWAVEIWEKLRRILQINAGWRNNLKSAHTALAVKACLLGGNSNTKCSMTFVNIAVAISALAGGAKNGFAPRPEYGGVFDIFRGFLGVWAQEGIEMEFWVILVAFRQWKNGQKWKKYCT